ncbi:MAG: pyridoxal-dependent decarboxylase, partial [Planctomycetota bacterium]
MLPPHLSPDEFRERGRRVVDWIADYYERVEQFPVQSTLAPGEVVRRLPSEPPQEGEPFDAVLRDLEEVILPGVTHWQSPNFFAYFPGNSSGPSVLGDLLASGLGVQGMLWETSPACTELEMVVLDWLVDALGLPDAFRTTRPGAEGGGVIQDTASSASLCALVAARERASGYAVRERGHEAGRWTAYVSEEAHSSLEKAARIAGVGSDHLRTIATDDQQRIDVAALERSIVEDRKRSATPFFVNATVGTTSTGAVDAVRAVGEIAQRLGLWFHVDAAMFGSAAVCPEFRSQHDGLELADSYCFNPHKWLLTNFDCSALYVADRAALTGALGILPAYLQTRTNEAGSVIDYRDWQVPLGRRFRSLKLWLVLRHYGVEGLRQHVRHHVGLAERFAECVRGSEEFEFAAEPALALVCFRHRAGEAFNRALLARVNDSGKCYLTHTVIDGRYA